MEKIGSHILVRKIGRNKFSRKDFLVFMTACMMASSALPVLAYKGDDEAIIDMSPVLDAIQAGVKALLPVFLIVLAIFIVIFLIIRMIRLSMV